MDTKSNIPAERGFSVHVPNLKEEGFGWNGEFTREDWRAVCLEKFLAGRDLFEQWQHSWKFLIKKDLQVKNFGVVLKYSDGSHVEVLSNLSDREEAYTIDFAGQTFKTDLILLQTEFFQKVIFCSAIFQEYFDFRDAKFHSKANFTCCTFKKGADFSRIVCSSESIVFDDVEFHKDAYFSSARFHGDMNFVRAKCQTDAYFTLATFRKQANFSKALFNGKVSFNQTAFFESVNFNENYFAEYVNFNNANFQKDVDFSNIIFNEKVIFTDSNFHDDAYFKRTIFNSIAIFTSVNFYQIMDFGSSIFNGGVDFQDANFSGEVLFSKSTYFGLTVNFKNVTFQNKASFNNAEIPIVDFGNAWFKKDAIFHAVNFNGTKTTFSNTIFDGIAQFSYGSFKGAAEFSHAIFNGDCYFSEAVFIKSADFFKAKFVNQCRFESNKEVTSFFDKVNFENTQIDNVGHFERVEFNGEIPNFLGVDNAKTLLVFSGDKFFNKNDTSEDAVKRIGQLKRLADEQGQTDQALMFNAFELNAKAKQPKAGFWFKVVTCLYDILSNYGRSFVRPLVAYLCLFALTLGIGLYNASITTLKDINCFDNFKIKYSNLLEIPCLNHSITVEKTKLNGYRAAFEFAAYRGSGVIDFSDNDKQTMAVSQRVFGQTIEPDWARFLGIFKAIASTALLFLAALGLRNKYRIK